MTAKDAIGMLLELGVSVEKNGVHLYKSRKGTYELLYFNGKGNLKQDTDKSFTEAQDAVAKFLQRLKQVKEIS